MQDPSPLARYIADRLQERHESADHFARRVGINPSGLYQLLRGTKGLPQQRTLSKIAGGLGMSAAELLAAVDGVNEPSERPEDTIAVSVDFPLSLRKRALGVAQDEDRTLSSLAVYAVRRYVSQRERELDLDRS
jgi:transcriptional regulator with XRE-family HTH domain